MALAPEKTAWVVLGVSFLVFCIFCAVLSIGIHFFIFQSDVSMIMLLNVGRGTVSTTTEGNRTPESIRLGREVLLGTTIDAGALDQATLSFVDNRQEWNVVAAITMRSDSVVSLFNAQRPRFDWNTNAYRIDLTNFSGRMDVFVAGGLDREFWMTITTQSGARVDLNQSGRYIVEANSNTVRVFNRSGVATIISANQESRGIPVGQQGMIRLPTGEMFVSAAYADLLRNPDFQATDLVDGASLPTIWQCPSAGSDAPLGAVQIDVWEGRTALRLLREGGGETHAESRCRQFFEPATVGLDVTGYTELLLRATFNVQFQSLSACGFVGSECPLMLRVDYVDVNGNGRQLYQGFYSSVNPLLSYPLTCDSCAQYHEFINPGAWYTYETNLFTRTSLEERPARILNVQFYASGHQYNVYVSEIALLGGTVSQP